MIAILSVAAAWAANLAPIEDPKAVPVVVTGQGDWEGFGYAQAGHRFGGGVVGDETFMCLLDRGRFATTTDLKHWTNHPMFPDWKGQMSSDIALCLTKEGDLAAAFTDTTSMGAHKSWVSDKVGMPADMSSKTYTTTSSDKGKTWTPMRLLQNQYCGAVRSMVQAGDGSLVLTTTSLIPKINRVVQYVYRSTDLGAAWKLVKTFDESEARGDHDGYLEGTMAALSADKVLLVLRTNKGSLYKSVSEDDGKTWSQPASMDIPASSSPATVLKLKSGRLVLLYDPYCPSGTDSRDMRTSRYPGSKEPASWYRGEAYVRWSDDEGASWSSPRLLLTYPNKAATMGGGKGLAYIQLVEAKPGEIWGNAVMGGDTVGTNGQFMFKESDLN